ARPGAPAVPRVAAIGPSLPPRVAKKAVNRQTKTRQAGTPSAGQPGAPGQPGKPLPGMQGQPLPGTKGAPPAPAAALSPTTQTPGAQSPGHGSAQPDTPPRTQPTYEPGAP